MRVIRYHERIADAAAHIVASAKGNDDHGSWAAAVALCGTACEAAAAYALRSFLEVDAARAVPLHHESLTRAIRELLDSTATVNLRVPTQCALWFALANDDIVSSWPDWHRYPPFVKLRNTVVHSGLVDKAGSLPSRTDADEALSIARSFHAHLKAVMHREGLASYA